MSNALISRVAASTLPPTPRLVAYVLANRTNADTGQCNPSVATIERESGLKRRAIQKALSWMREQSLLSVTFTGSSSRYSLSLPDTGRGAPHAGGAPDAPAHHMQEGAHHMQEGGAPEAPRGAPQTPKPKEPKEPKEKPQGTASASEKNKGLSIDQIQADGLNAANAVTLGHFCSPELHTLWTEWQIYRSTRATTGPKSKRLLWTAQAARMSAQGIESAILHHPERVVCDRIRSAIAGNWQGLNLDKLESPKPKIMQRRNILF